MSSAVESNRLVTLSGKPVTIRKITGRKLMDLVGAYNRNRVAIGVEPDEVRFDGAALRKLINNVLGALGLDAEGKLTPTAADITGTLARVLEVSPDQWLDATLDEQYSTLEALAEVNGDGPLGQQLRRITASLRPTVGLLMDLTIASLRQGLMTAPRSGGMSAGGMTTSSSPSTESLAGPSETSSMTSPSSESTESSPPSATSTAIEPPSSTEASPAAESPSSSPQPS